MADGEGSDGFSVGGPLAQRIRALGADAAEADRTGRRVRSDMDAMLTRLGLDPATVRATAALEILAAETCCASCRQVERCHGYLEDRPDEPTEFCPNAATFAGVGHGS